MWQKLMLVNMPDEIKYETSKIRFTSSLKSIKCVAIQNGLT